MRAAIAFLALAFAATSAAPAHAGRLEREKSATIAKLLKKKAKAAKAKKKAKANKKARAIAKARSKTTNAEAVAATSSAPRLSDLLPTDEPRLIGEPVPPRAAPVPTIPVLIATTPGTNATASKAPIAPSKARIAATPAPIAAARASVAARPAPITPAPVPTLTIKVPTATPRAAIAPTSAPIATARPPVTATPETIAPASTPIAPSRAQIWATTADATTGAVTTAVASAAAAATVAEATTISSDAASTDATGSAVATDDLTSTELVASTTPRAGRVSRIEFAVDSGPVMRRLRYRDDWKRDGQTVRGYDLTANAVSLQVTARPAQKIELVASGELLVRVAGSEGPDAEVHSTSSSEIQLGARFVDDIGPVRVGLDVALGQHRFAIDDEMSAFGELVPDTTYRYVRVGARAAVPVTRAVRITSAVAYRALLGTGDLASEKWFPQASGGGVDVAVGIELQITRGFHAHVRGQVRRYFFAMNPEVGDELVVGGALDQYLSLAAGLSLAIR